MAKISNYPYVEEVTGAEILPVVQDGVNKQINIDDLIANSDDSTAIAALSSNIDDNSTAITVLSSNTQLELDDRVSYTPQTTTDEEKAQARANVGIVPPVILSDSSDRKNLASYPDGISVGITRVIQADMVGIIWALIGADATADSSWIGQPYTVDPDGTVVVNMELADVDLTVPDKNVLGQVGSIPTIGDGESVGGRRIAMRSDVVDGYIFFSSVATADITMHIRQDGVDGATGVCYSIDGGTPVFSALENFTIPHNNGAPCSVALWPASSATSGRKGNITFADIGTSSVPSGVISVDTRGSDAYRIVIKGSLLEVLNFDSNASLTYLSLGTFTTDNTTAKSVITSNCPLLSNLSLERLVNVKTIDLSANLLLHYFEASDSGLTSLDLSNNPLVAVLRIENTAIETLNISGVEDVSISASGSNLTKIIGVGHTPTHYYHDHYIYEDFRDNQLTTDAVYNYLDDITRPDIATAIELAGNPCCDGGYLHDGADPAHTAALTEQLAADKNVTLLYS